MFMTAAVEAPGCHVTAVSVKSVRTSANVVSRCGFALYTPPYASPCPLRSLDFPPSPIRSRGGSGVGDV